jgi:hypothetical protein
VAGQRDHQRWRRQWREKEEEGSKREMNKEGIGRSKAGALLWSMGVSEGGALLSTVARAGLPRLHPRAQP